ncbi:MAG: glycoside hydrolase family 88 protein [Holophagaceae bacterium]|nr:glycoside hydrolase family 88 protein [Holophagaceae bacterium]
MKKPLPLFLNIFASLAIVAIVFILVIFRASRPKIDKTTIEATQRTVADWMLEHRRETPGGRGSDNTWTIGAWYVGMFSLYEQTGDHRYLEPLMAMENTVGWKLGKRPFFGDDQVIAQVYCDLYRTVKQDPSIIAHTIEVVDQQMAIPDPGLGAHTSALFEKGAWSWCDGLFMAPPMWARLALVTGDRKYLDAMDDKYWKSYDFLYDKEEKLFYRDSSYFEQREQNGQKVFWSRGNGWVMGGLARLLDVLPGDYPTRNKYQALFVEMAERIRGLQQADGLWRPSLLDPESYPTGETSGTAFFTYALAWGVNNNLLKAQDYKPAITRAWLALINSIQPDGRLGWAQPIGQDPKLVKAEDTEVYAVGAFLLAGREILNMK